MEHFWHEIIMIAIVNYNNIQRPSYNHFLCATYCSKHASNNLFFYKVCTLMILILKMRNWSTEELYSFPKIAKLFNVRVNTQTQPVWFYGPTSSPLQLRNFNITLLHIILLNDLYNVIYMIGIMSLLCLYSNFLVPQKLEDLSIAVSCFK